MTQEQMAQILECTTKGLSKIEKGLSSPRGYTIRLFENHFKVKLNRYYQNNTEALPLDSYEFMWEMLVHSMSGDHKKAYKKACQFEESTLPKNSEARLNINYIKGRFYSSVAENQLEALKYYIKGIEYEDYMYYDQEKQMLNIESFMPSVYSLQLVAHMAECLRQCGSIESAVQMTEECLRVLKKFIDMPVLMHFCYSKEDILYSYSNIESHLSELYYEQRRFEDALDTIKSSLENHTVFGALHLGEKYYIKFKSLCSLNRFGEAMQILPDVLFHNKRTLSIANFEALQVDLSESFPEVSKQINAFFNMFSSIMCILG